MTFTKSIFTFLLLALVSFGATAKTQVNKEKKTAESFIEAAHAMESIDANWVKTEYKLLNKGQKIKLLKMAILKCKMLHLN